MSSHTLTLTSKELTLKQQIKTLRGGIQMLSDAIQNHLDDVAAGRADLNKQNIASWTLYLRADERMLKDLEAQEARRQTGIAQTRTPTQSRTVDELAKMNDQVKKLHNSIHRESQHLYQVARVRDKKINQLVALEDRIQETKEKLGRYNI